MKMNPWTVTRWTVTRWKLRGAIAASMFLAVTSVGCTNMTPKRDMKLSDMVPKMPWSSDKDEKPEPYPNPVKLAATWTPDTLVQTGRTPTRGFGGRLFFFDEKSRAVPVEGTLSVHGFDESETDPKKKVRPFAFTPDQFTRHFSQSDLGASYSIWIPWDAVGADQKSISLVATFKTTDGKIVQGVPATITLPGPNAKNTIAMKTEQYSPQYHNHQRATSVPTMDTSGLATTTIRRRNAVGVPSKPEIRSYQLPPSATDSALAADNGKTPYLDMSPTKRTGKVILDSPTAVLPASATLPMHGN
ncbi:hypothetical protein [Stieleria varia]|uniref:Uncharacterized protein n=1 Tax=Stieleria varia TaxID=2528005 RepID=A0A5C6B777_9BACT|nr:hypothetical protein [Stieleria varia]TWU07637.1 hypothetical protein Pla52n_02100 [Stieleria varia]